MSKRRKHVDWTSISSLAASQSLCRVCQLNSTEKEPSGMPLMQKAIKMAVDQSGLVAHTNYLKKVERPNSSHDLRLSITRVKYVGNTTLPWFISLKLDIQRINDANIIHRMSGRWRWQSWISEILKQWQATHRCHIQVFLTAAWCRKWKILGCFLSEGTDMITARKHTHTLLSYKTLVKTIWLRNSNFKECVQFVSVVHFFACTCYCLLKISGRFSTENCTWTFAHCVSLPHSGFVDVCVCVSLWVFHPRYYNPRAW